eukprot:COSAG01_NODE_678_length_14293_cov_14.229388_4_plen_173_part_00
MHDVDVAALQAALTKAGQKLEVGGSGPPASNGETAIALGSCGGAGKASNASWTYSKSGQLLDENGKCLSVWGDSFKSGARLVGASCHPIGKLSSNQVWSVKPAACAAVQIAIRPDLCLVASDQVAAVQAGKVTLGACSESSSDICLHGSRLMHKNACVQSSKARDAHTSNLE